MLVRPEGLLGEFRAKYVRDAEAAPAPRWGIRIPVMPKIAWPALSQVMVPMGGLAAAAAAARLVALHSQPMGAQHGPPARAPPLSRVASRHASPSDRATAGAAHA